MDVGLIIHNIMQDALPTTPQRWEEMVKQKHKVIDYIESLQAELEAVKAKNKILEANCVLSYKELRELLERR